MLRAMCIFNGEVCRTGDKQTSRQPTLLVFFKLAVTVHRCLNGRAPVRLLRFGRWCRHSAAPAFRQPSTVCSTSLPAQHLRPSGLFSCRPHSLELSPGFHPGSDHQCILFQTFAKKRTCSLDTSAFSVLEVLDDNRTLYLYYR